MVELRTRTHLYCPSHSIRAIKDGSVKILLNQDVRGKPKLKYRLLVDIYNQENTTKDDESVPKVVKDMDNVSSEDLCSFGGEADVETVSDCFNVTLEKIRRQCGKKKRKLRNSGVEVKEECLTLETEDEGCDFEEPLSNFKKRKRKQESKSKSGSMSSSSAKQIDLPVFCDVKPEAAWDDSYLVSEVMECNKEEELTTNAELVEETMHDLSMDTRPIIYCSPEPNSSGVAVTEEPITTRPVENFFEDASEDFSDAMNARDCLAGSVSREEIEETTHELSKETGLVLCRSPEPISCCSEEPVTTNMVEDTFEDASEEFGDEGKAQGCLADNIDLESQTNVWCSSVSREENQLEVSQSSDSETIGLPVSCDVKIEASDDSYSVSEAMECNKEAGSTASAGLVEDNKDTRLVLYRSPEPNSSRMVAIEKTVTTKPVDKASKDASEEFNDATKVRCSLADYIALENQENVLYGGVYVEEIEQNSSGMVAIEETITTKPVDEACKDSSEEFNDAREAKGCLADNIDLADQFNVLYSSVSREEIELKVPQSSDSETIRCNTSSGSEEAKEGEQNNDSKPKLDTTIACLENVKVEEAPEILVTDSSGFKVENTEIVLETEDIVKYELPEAVDMMQLTNFCNSLANLQLCPDDGTIPLEEDQVPKRLQQQHQHKNATSGHVDEPADHKTPQLYKEPDEVTETESIKQQKLHNQPEKLLSGRKVLSPTSQAKLRKAMEHPDLPDEKRSKKSKGKLYFSSQISHRILKAQGLDNIDRVEVIPNSKQSINNTQGKQFQRATTRRFPHRETRAARRQPFSTGCTSIQGCTKKAIAFSQGQVHDFQFIATRLANELKSMTEITKRCLLAETNTSNMPDSNFDEVKTLIRNAEKTKKSSEKWLSILERDSNRFCKLMGMVSEDAPVTENIVQKEKKIRFADDAGGDLCHVKVFEIDLESESNI